MSICRQEIDFSNVNFSIEKFLYVNFRLRNSLKSIYWFTNFTPYHSIDSVRRHSLQTQSVDSVCRFSPQTQSIDSVRRLSPQTQSVDSVSRLTEAIFQHLTEKYSVQDPAGCEISQVGVGVGDWGISSKGMGKGGGGQAGLGNQALKRSIQRWVGGPGPQESLSIPDI